MHSLEIRPALARQARVHLKSAGIGNAEVEEADAFAWQSTQPAWDIIVLTGSLPVYDARFESLLAPEGRLFVVTGNAPVMEARLISKDQQGLLQSSAACSKPSLILWIMRATCSSFEILENANDKYPGNTAS